VASISKEVGGFVFANKAIITLSISVGDLLDGLDLLISTSIILLGIHL
jgi:hypothetical protein